MTKVRIVGIAEPVLSDECPKIIDVRLPALRVLRPSLNATGTGTVNWTALDGTGIPDVSVNAFVVDPAKDHLYAGTDRGVFNSTDGVQPGIHMAPGCPTWRYLISRSVPTVTYVRRHTGADSTKLQ